MSLKRVPTSSLRREQRADARLYRTARRINDLVATGHLAASALNQLAQSAAAAGLGTHEITRTIASARSRASVLR